MIAQRNPQSYGAELIDGIDPVYGDTTGLETITIPPGNDKVRVCAGWPECDCRGDCETIVLGPAAAERRILFATLICVAVAGCGLIWLAVQ